MALEIYQELFSSTRSTTIEGPTPFQQQMAVVARWFKGEIDRETMDSEIKKIDPIDLTHLVSKLRPKI